MGVSPPYNLLAPKMKTACFLDPDIIATICTHITTLTLEIDLEEKETQFRKCFSQVFKLPPHSDLLPDQPRAHIHLKDPSLTPKSRNYPCPRKWRDAWHKLLQQHLTGRRI